MQIQLFLSLKVKFKYSCGNFKPSSRLIALQIKFSNKPFALFLQKLFLKFSKVVYTTIFTTF